jgi:hypothetical protein
MMLQFVELQRSVCMCRAGHLQVGNFGHDYWDWLLKTVNNCPQGKYFITAHKVFDVTYNLLNATIYSSVTGMILAVLYYLLRPSDKTTFEAWWVRGKYAVLFILGASTTALVCALSLSGNALTAQWYFGFETEMCMVANVEDRPYARYQAAMGSGMFFLAFLTAVGTILML